MRFIAYLAALAGLALMAFGLWGLRAPQKVNEIVTNARHRVIHLSRSTAVKLRETLQSEAKAQDERKPLAPVMDPNFVPVTIEEKYGKYLFCMTAEEPCPGFSLDSASAYYDDLREQITRELNAYYEYLRANPLKIQQADVEFARQLLNDATPDVQVAALNIIGLFPASEENLTSVAEVLRDTTDDGVLDAGLRVLDNYRGNRDFERVITKALKDQIGYGISDFTATIAARRLFPFLSEDNIDDFKRLREEMNYVSTNYRMQTERLKILDSALREYERDRLLNR